MTVENQMIEYKEIWQEKYLEWICGYANAQGGTLYIGCKDDGTPIGLEEKMIKKLLEDIPNRVKAKMSILVDCNEVVKQDKHIVEIKVNQSYYPVNIDGAYHYRSGATKQLLTGNALNNFLLKKARLEWEDVPVESIKYEDLDKESFDIFRREALKSKRMSKEELDISNEELLDKLNLTTDGKLTRAAVLLFYREPSRIITGCSVKLGRFSDNRVDILYQDEVEGSLMLLADRVIDLIYLKYLKASISYEHDVRVETYPFIREAVREAVFNALMHNDYSYGVPIQIRMDNNEMRISNDCMLPDNWDADTLLGPHKSEPRNPNIAKTFYRAGYVETWGRGIEKICEACKEEGANNPRYEVLGHGITLIFDALKIENDTTKETEKEVSKRKYVFPSNISDKKIEYYKIILDILSDGKKHKATEIANALKLKETRTKVLLRELRQLEMIDVEGKTSSTTYKIK